MEPIGFFSTLLEIYVMNVEGAAQGAPNVRRLTNDPADDFNAVWQPLLTD